MLVSRQQTRLFTPRMDQALITRAGGHFLAAVLPQVTVCCCTARAGYGRGLCQIMCIWYPATSLIKSARASKAPCWLQNIQMQACPAQLSCATFEMHVHTIEHTTHLKNTEMPAGPPGLQPNLRACSFSCCCACATQPVSSNMHRHMPHALATVHHKHPLLLGYIRGHQYVRFRWVAVIHLQVVTMCLAKPLHRYTSASDCLKENSSSRT